MRGNRFFSNIMSPVLSRQQYVRKLSKFLEYQTIALVAKLSLGINSELLNIPAYALENG